MDLTEQMISEAAVAVTGGSAVKYGEHTIDFKLTTSYGREVSREDRVTLVEGLPPRCTLETSNSREDLLVVAGPTAQVERFAALT